MKTHLGEHTQMLLQLIHLYIKKKSIDTILFEKCNLIYNSKIVSTSLAIAVAILSPLLTFLAVTPHVTGRGTV